jgi:hypothetical protein
MPYRSGGADYLRQYPKLWKWMNQCLVCGHIGHKPELPTRIGEGVAAHHLRQYFPELSLDERGLCDQCRAIKRGRMD